MSLQPEFMAETPRLVFEGPYVNVGGLSYDVAPDGRRLLLLEPAEQAAPPVTHLNVVLNWFEAVKQKAGVGLSLGQRLSCPRRALSDWQAVRSHDLLWRRA